MIKELCHDEAILSQRCEVATVEDESVAQDLIDTIKSLDDAGCLAANQIGVTKKVCVYLDDAGEPHVLYNPRLVFGLEMCIRDRVRIVSFGQVIRYA